MVHNFGTPKQCIKGRTQVLHVLRAEDNEILLSTLKHHFGSNGVEWMIHIFGTPETVYLGSKHKFCLFLAVEG
jgi:hypothetical protein